PEGTVMSRLHRARKRIRDRLAAAGLAPKQGGGGR
ncbi:MAG: RNA polymerase sigma factor, partial [Catenulispora sp.]|nr:RNA polymerase sigma factor [Catenulispora sp.]